MRRAMMANANAGGRGVSPPPPDAPGAPAALSVNAQSWRTNVLFWTLPDDLSTSIRIERQVEPGGWLTLDTIGGREKCYVDSSIYGLTDYDYRITAINGSGSSSPSSMDSVTSLDPDDDLGVVASLLPASVTVTPVTPATNLVAWTGDFTITGSIPAGMTFQIERSTDLELWTPRWAQSYLYGFSFQDTGLEPGETYYYRVRAYYNAGYSAWSTAGNGTQSARTAGFPVEPAALRATTHNATKIKLSWTGSGTGTDWYQIQRCDNPEAQPNNRVWNLTHTTAAGETTWTATGLTALTSYGFRVRSVNATGASDYTAAEGLSVTDGQTVANSSADYGEWIGFTAGTLTGIYEIGPGKTYANWAAFEASNGGNATSRLGGDDDTDDAAVVSVYFDTYTEAPQFGGRGTPTNRVTIQGILSGNDRPILDADGAVILNPDPDGSGDGREGRGQEYEIAAVLFVGRNSSVTPVYFEPGHVLIKNLHFKNAYDGFTGTAEAARVINWSHESAGIDLADCRDVTIENCWFDSNGNGIFGKSYGDISLYSNRFTNNGNASGAGLLSHHVYIECRRVIAMYNWFEPAREEPPFPSGGAGLKLRAVDIRVKANFFQNTGTPIQISEVQDLNNFAYIFPERLRPIVTGNVFCQMAGVNEFDHLVPPIWFNGDQQSEPLTRGGILYLSHNTYLFRAADGETRVLYNLGYPTAIIDSRNNISRAIPNDGTGTIGQYLVTIANLDENPHCMRFERDFIGPAFTETPDNAGVLVGELYGLAGLDDADPEFEDETDYDLHPATGSPLIDAAVALAARVVSLCPADRQYSHPQTSVARTPGDIGAFEFALDPGPLPGPILPPATAYTFTGPSSGEVNLASTNFTVTPNGNATGITVTPASDGAGSFTPASVTFTGTAARTFTYTPTSTTGSPHTLSVTDDGGLTDPAAIDYTVNAAADLLSGLVSFWDEDEASGGRLDQPGANDFTEVGSVGSGAGPGGHTIADFPGGANYLSKGSNASLQIGNADKTFQAWVNLDAKGFNPILAKWGGTGLEYMLWYRSDQDKFEFLVTHDGSTQASVRASTFGSPSTGTLYCLHAWHDAANDLIGISVNAGTADTAAHALGVHTSAEGFKQGQDGFGNALAGLSGLVGIWDRVLSGAERISSYNAGSGKSFSQV